jgi:DNA-binding IclR family transcriptional regulator
VDAVQIGLNALAAPVFDHRGDWRGSLAIVGSSTDIPETPSEAMIEMIADAARTASRQLGWRNV